MGLGVVNGSRVVVQHGPVPAPLSLLHNSASKYTFSNGPVLTKEAIGRPNRACSLFPTLSKSGDNPPKEKKKGKARGARLASSEEEVRSAGATDEDGANKGSAASTDRLTRRGAAQGGPGCAQSRDQARMISRRVSWGIPAQR